MLTFTIRKENGNKSRGWNHVESIKNNPELSNFVLNTKANGGS